MKKVHWLLNAAKQFLPYKKFSTCTVALNVNSIPHNKTVGNFIFLFL